MKRVLRYTAVIAFILSIATTYSFAQYVPTLEPTSSTIQISTPTLSLNKKVFSPWENITLSYTGDPKPLTAKITNAKGEEIEFQAVLRDGKTLEVEIPKDISPGKYHILVQDGDKTLIDEDLFWGLNISNQRVSILKPGQVGQSDVVLFSNDGVISCEKEQEAQLVNLVTNEEKKQPIPQPGDCSKDNPKVYETIYQTDNIGPYILKVKDQNSGQELVSAFEVVNEPSFEVRREASTFVKKDNEYGVKITVVANEDFEGNLTEEIPTLLNPSNLDSADVKNTDSIGDDKSTMNLSLPFQGDYPITLHFGEEPDAETHLLEAYRAYGVRAHDGVDFAVPPGTEIISVDDGEVIEIPPSAVAYGVTVAVQHGWGKSFYGHLSAKKVKPGDKVKKGDLVGLSGNTGLSTGPHLHFGVEPNDLKADNGYLGKIDPLETLSIKNKFKTSTKKLNWNITAKKGETVTVGYKIKFVEDTGNLISGTKLSAKNKDGQTKYEDKNPWTYVVVR